MTTVGVPQRNKVREPKPCAFLTRDTIEEVVGYLIRRFEIERRRQRRAYLFVRRQDGAVYLLGEDCPLVEAWVLARLTDYVGCYFAGRPNHGTDKASYDMPPDAEGLSEDLSDHMGYVAVRGV